MGTATYGMRLTPAVRAEALAKAQVNALEAYVAESSAAKVRIFDQRRSEFTQQVDRYVLSSVVLSEDDNRKAKTFTISVRSEVNATLLQVALDGGSAVATSSSGQRSLLTFLFMARMQDTAQSFDDKNYKRADARQVTRVDNTYNERTSEGESFGGSSISTSGTKRTIGGSSEDSSSMITTGGSTTRRSDVIEWKVANASEVNSVMTGAFSAAGYEVVEAEYVEAESGGQLSIEKIRSDFSTGDDLSAATLRSTANGIRTAGIPYIAIGTLDVGMRDVDPVSGNVRVYVTVTGKVLDVTGRFPRTVSSVGPVQYAGLGPDQSVARTNALRLAAAAAARQMVDELNVKNIR
ncbi:MAG: hypothetical protein ABI858_05955 [Pseudoxanthomonas sp.]